MQPALAASLVLAALGVVAWGLMGVFLLGGVVAFTLLERSYRKALAIFVAATIAGLAFSFLGGFSIGRFTSLAPLLMTAFAVTYARGTAAQLLAVAAACAIYYSLAWLFPERVGFWGIHIELILCTAAYGLAFLNPPRRRLAAERPVQSYIARLVARIASVLAVMAGIATGIFLVFGPTYTECRSPTIEASGQVIGTQTCRTASMWDLQGISGFPAPYGFIAIWSLAPLLAFTAAWLVARNRERRLLAGLALAIDASVFISFGAAPLYLPLVLPLVFITWLAVYLDGRPASLRRGGLSAARGGNR